MSWHFKGGATLPYGVELYASLIPLEVLYIIISVKSMSGAVESIKTDDIITADDPNNVLPRPPTPPKTLMLLPYANIRRAVLLAQRLQ